MKICSKCQKVLPLDSFHKDKKGKLGVASACKDCINSYQREHRTYTEEQLKARRQRAIAYKNNNKEKYDMQLKAHKRKMYAEMSKEEKAAQLERLKQYKRSKGTKAATQARRRAKQKQATPVWSSIEKAGITNLYKEAEEKGLEVDHIVPLNSEFVCGLHCLSNLQLLTPEENNKKSNLYWPDMH